MQIYFINEINETKFQNIPDHFRINQSCAILYIHIVFINKIVHPTARSASMIVVRLRRGEFKGETTMPDLLENIFITFCIGK